MLVLGGCRFIGYDAARTLAERGYRVSVLDDRRCPGPVEGLEVHRAGPASVGLLDYVRGVDVVVNAYEFEGVNEARMRTGDAYRANVELAYRIHEAVIGSSVEKVIHLSTAAVYGEAEHTPIPESHRTLPVNWYGASRLAGETIIYSLYTERRVPVVVLRVFNVYGPGEWLRNNPGVVYEFITAALGGGYIRLEGGGGQVRDFVHVIDVVRAVEESMDLAPGVYNVGSGKGVSIRDLADLIVRIHGEPVEVVIANPRPGDVLRSIADIAKITGASRWRPLVPLEYGLEKLYQLYREKLSTAAR
ncbi:MAG: NAD-dependent epimerase/dehydratase family protein [Desulfurococcales archaeon]|nr:NAD-dependent epimerase/dehydratase family protein [Desulfurococcales archaeon]